MPYIRLNDVTLGNIILSLGVVAALVLSLSGDALAAANLKIDSRADILVSSKSLAHDLMTFYNGNQSGQIPGILPGPPPAGPYYFWEAAHFWSAFIDYWRITGDATYNEVALQGMEHQVGPGSNFMPSN